MENNFIKNQFKPQKDLIMEQIEQRVLRDDKYFKYASQSARKMDSLDGDCSIASEALFFLKDAYKDASDHKEQLQYVNRKWLLEFVKTYILEFKFADDDYVCDAFRDIYRIMEMFSEIVKRGYEKDTDSVLQTYFTDLFEHTSFRMAYDCLKEELKYVEGNYWYPYI